jgi:hypothetical protein
MSIIENRMSGFFGSTGGGGGVSSVATDNLTILGNGTSLNPLYATGQTFAKVDVSLASSDYNIIKQGLYYVLVGGSQNIIFNYTPLDGQRITIINGGNTNANIVPDLGLILYQGSLESVLFVPIGATYEFLYIASEQAWYCYNTEDLFCPSSIDLNSWGSNYPISVAGIYGFFNNLFSYGVILPNPQYYSGLKIVIINFDILTSLAFTIPYRPTTPNGTIITNISAGSSIILQSINNAWRITS